MHTHHAQIIEAGQNDFDTIVAWILKEFGLSKNHPNAQIFSFGLNKLGVDDAHKLKESLQKKPIIEKGISSKNIVIVYAHTLTEQAQNALLKITEEPPEQTMFFLITNSVEALLPTLRSRCVVIDKQVKTGQSSPPDSFLLPTAQEFIESDIATRLNIVKQIHGSMDKDDLQVGQVWDLVNKIEEYVVGKNTESSLKNHDLKQRLDALVRTQSYMHSPGNSIKMLLEYLAITL